MKETFSGAHELAPDRASVYGVLSLSRISILSRRGKDMAMWRKRLFAFMSRNAASPVRYFNLPEDRVISLGTTIVL